MIVIIGRVFVALLFKIEGMGLQELIKKHKHLRNEYSKLSASERNCIEGVDMMMGIKRLTVLIKNYLFFKDYQS